MPAATVSAMLHRYPAAQYAAVVEGTWLAAHNYETARILAGDDGVVYAPETGGRWVPVNERRSL